MDFEFQDDGVEGQSPTLPISPEMQKLVDALKGVSMDMFQEEVADATSGVRTFKDEVAETVKQLRIQRNERRRPDQRAGDDPSFSKQKDKSERVADLQYRSVENALAQLLSRTIGSSFYPMLTAFRLQREAMKEDGFDPTDLNFSDIIKHLSTNMRDVAGQLPFINKIAKSVGFGPTPEMVEEAREDLLQREVTAEELGINVPKVDEEQNDKIVRALEAQGYERKSAGIPPVPPKTPSSLSSQGDPGGDENRMLGGLTDGATISGITGLGALAFVGLQYAQNKIQAIGERISDVLQADKATFTTLLSSDNEGKAGQFVGNATKSVSSRLNLLGEMPIIGTVFKVQAAAVDVAGQVLSFTIQNTQALAEEIGGLSSAVVEAQIDRELAFLEQAFRRSESLDGSINAMLKAQTSLEIEIGRASDKFYEAITPLMVPILNTLTQLVRVGTNTAVGVAQGVAAVTGLGAVLGILKNIEQNTASDVLFEDITLPNNVMQQVRNNPQNFLF